MSTMTLIQLGRPIGSCRKLVGFGQWRTVFKYRCPNGHEVGVFANSFRGTRPEPGVGAITCPQCEFHAKYGKTVSDDAS
jgi:hypothetical protein